MRVRIKICGLCQPEAVEAAVAAGADAVGFVFAESPRRVDPARAAALALVAGPYVTRVAVFRDFVPALVDEVQRVLDPDLYQADASASSFAIVGARFFPVYRDDAEDDALQRAIDARSHASFLYEGRLSGAGERVDWERARRLARRGRMVLAGGLDPDNVARAIERVRPYGVDVSSGVESRLGVKDLGRIRAFVEAVRATERGMAPGVPDASTSGR